MAEDTYQRSLTLLDPVPWIVQPNVRGSNTPALATAPADTPLLEGNVDRNIAGVLPRLFHQPRRLLRVRVGLLALTIMSLEFRSQKLDH